jgi:tetratricopeptide (TPR) repeat protein
VKKSLFHKTFTHLILIVILGLIAYSNTFHVPFHFDDKPFVVKNPIIKDLRFFAEPSKAKDFKGRFEYNVYKRRYIGYLTFALNYKIHGLNVPGYHIINVFIHVCTALLVYLLVHLTFQTPFLLTSKLRDYSQQIALFAALLFAGHPLQTQAVTYIWQRVSSLSTLFYVLSLVAYVKWRLKWYDKPVSEPPGFFNMKSVSLYLISIISAIFAMKTKETAFMLPVMVTLYEFIFFQGKTRKRVLYLTPLLLTMLIIPLTLINIDTPLGDLIGDISDKTKGYTTLSREAYLLTSFRVMVTYIRLLFLPINQNLDYDYPTYSSFFNIEVVISFLFLLLIFGTGVFLLHRYRHNAVHIRLISFGIFWFFINLLLESSIIPLNNVIFEHRMYLPSIGALIAITTSLFWGIETLKDKWKNIKRFVIVLLVLILVLLTETTYVRNRVWGDEITLWQDVVKKSPKNQRGHHNLGNAYMSLGFIDKAIYQYRTALQIQPNYAKVHNNLGTAYEKKGLTDKAIRQYKIALKLKTDFKDARYNLGLAYGVKGLIDKAIKEFIHALELDPYDADIYFAMGIAYKYQGYIDKAIEQYQIALRVKPDFKDAHKNIGFAYFKKGNIEKAIYHLESAIKLDPNDSKAHINLGIVYKSKGLTDKANEHFRIARQLNPTLFKGIKSQN